MFLHVVSIIQPSYSTLFETYLQRCSVSKSNRHSFQIEAHRSSPHVPWKCLEQSFAAGSVGRLQSFHHVANFQSSGFGELGDINSSWCLRKNRRRRLYGRCESRNAGPFSFSTSLAFSYISRRISGRHLASKWDCMQKHRRSEGLCWP